MIGVFRRAHTLFSDAVPIEGAMSSAAAALRDIRRRSACFTRTAVSATRSSGTLYSSHNRCRAVMCASLCARDSESRLIKLAAPRWSITPSRTLPLAADSARGSSASTAGRSSNMVGSERSKRPYSCPFPEGCEGVGDEGGGSGKEVSERSSSCWDSSGRRLERLLRSPTIASISLRDVFGK